MLDNPFVSVMGALPLDELDKPDFPDILRGPWLKMEGYCARLALILHECRFASGEADSEVVDEVSVSGAAKLVDYFKCHAQRVYSQLRVTPEDKKIVAAIQWIRHHGGQTTVRELMHKSVVGVKTRDDAYQLFHQLEQRGYGVIEEKTNPRGGRTSVLFKIHTEPTTDKPLQG